VQTRRWVNQSQPQTLFIATVLLYFNVVLILLGGSTLLGAAIDGHKVFGGVAYGDMGETINNFARLFLAVGGAGAGYLIAQEKKNGWYLGIAVAVLPLLAQVLVVVRFQVSPFKFDLVNTLFEIALVALILHEQSRNYVRLWFK
jgi:hypothetical protein